MMEDLKKRVEEALREIQDYKDYHEMYGANSIISNTYDAIDKAECVIKELTEREASLAAEIEELKGQHERLERKKDDYPNVLAKVMNDLETLRAAATERETALVEENKHLQNVADVAALCCIDLDYNLQEANKEYMSGKIARGAFEYVLMRHTNLHETLHKAGYTEKHKFFDYPARPKSLGINTNGDA